MSDSYSGACWSCGKQEYFARNCMLEPALPSRKPTLLRAKPQRLNRAHDNTVVVTLVLPADNHHLDCTINGILAQFSLYIYRLGSSSDLAMEGHMRMHKKRNVPTDHSAMQPIQQCNPKSASSRWTKFGY